MKAYEVVCVRTDRSDPCAYVDNPETARMLANVLKQQYVYYGAIKKTGITDYVYNPKPKDVEVRH